MSHVLVDSSIWIEYLRGSRGVNVAAFHELIDLNKICINDLVLAELLPHLLSKKQNGFIGILKSIRNMPLRIDWNDIVDIQVVNLRNGLNRIGIPDLIIVQNVKQNNLLLYSLDRHFHAMSRLHGFSLME